MEVVLLLGAIALVAVLAVVLIFSCAWCRCPNSEGPIRHDYVDEYRPQRTSPPPPGYRGPLWSGPPPESQRSRTWAAAAERGSRVLYRNTTDNATRTRPRPQPYSIGRPSSAPASAEQVAYETRKRETEALVRAEQDDVLREIVVTGQLNSKPSPLNHGNYGLLIAADATPKHAGGYCVDLVQKTCAFYSLPLTRLPWSITPSVNSGPGGDSDEFEMKNLLFAILLWLPVVRKFKKQKQKRQGGQQAKAKRVLICTDNFACRQADNEYGQRVTAFLNHLRQCEDVLIDSRVYGTNQPNLRKHAVFLKPADDFSRNSTAEAKQFLAQMYGIPSERIAPVEVRSDVIHHRLTEECPDCGFQIERSPSLRSFRLLA